MPMEEKKSFFEKFKLVDRIEKESLSQEQEQEQEKENTYIDTNSKLVDKDNKMDNEESKAPIEDNKDSCYKNENQGTNKLLSVDEIYFNSNLENKKINTIFLIDSYVKALPENLPTEVKRQAVLNIIKASDMNIDALVKDGQDRLNVLNDFTTIVTDKTSNIITSCEEEIKELYKKIDGYKKLINERQKFQEEQKACIDYEVQKIQSIVDFIE
jgi:hypothetical protein